MNSHHEKKEVLCFHLSKLQSAWASHADAYWSMKGEEVPASSHTIRGQRHLPGSGKLGLLTYSA